MNNPHGNAPTTRLGRAEMIRRILEEDQPIREVAAGLGISERSARKWLARYRAEGPSGLENRSSCPRTVANRTTEYWIGVIEHLRQEYRLTAEEIAGKLDLARSTVAAWLTRRGLGRLTALEPMVLFQRNGEHFLYEGGGSPCPRHALRKSFRMRLFGSP